MGQFSIWHWLIVAAVFVLFFGAKRMPDAARGLGRSLRIFKSEVSQMQNEGSSTAPAAQPVAPQQLPPAQPANPVAQPQAQPESKSL
ncbi:Sec-independent protein translocase subunit TatA [Nocardia sp. XZ_19_385]|uniref:Sec-independent protein translocase subunit TatA n=1 Tax=Nocardia sp. XZ_19_385 TaxID=2769488 RepID=UPI00188EC1D1|nr:Sec-independent protein translocase subunit TatA [Nocardia sp. XZ_19_385]